MILIGMIIKTTIVFSTFVGAYLGYKYGCKNW
jgi:hypothetical protein